MSIVGHYSLSNNVPLTERDLRKFGDLSAIFDRVVNAREKLFGNVDVFGISWSKSLEQHPSNLKLRACASEFFERFRWVNWFYSGSLILPYQFPESIPNVDYTLHRFLQMSAGAPARWTTSLPLILGEVGHNVNGVCVNQDSCNYQERINLLRVAGILDWLESKSHTTIVEIGAGFGALAYLLCSGLKNITYFIVDLPMGIFHSSCYLSKALPDLEQSIYLGQRTSLNGLNRDLVTNDPGIGRRESGSRVIYVPNFLAQDFQETIRAHLAINTLSMSEMHSDQVRQYGRLIQGWIHDTGFFFEQNSDNTAIRGGINSKTLLRDFFSNRVTLGCDYKLESGTPDVWGCEMNPNSDLADFRTPQLLNSMFECMRPIESLRNEPNYFLPQIQELLVKYGCDAPQFIDPRLSRQEHPHTVRYRKSLKLIKHQIGKLKPSNWSQKGSF